MADQPRWLLALVAALQEALPRLHGCQGDPLVEELIGDLTEALADGRLAITVPSSAHRRALLASPLLTDAAGPLVLADDQLQWRLWHQRRQGVLTALQQRALQPLPALAEPGAAERVLALVAAHGDGLDPRQQAAVAAVLSRPLVLLEGGPGTGKTSTVSRMLAAVREQQPDCRVQLAAPTGKAAARLRASLDQVSWPCTTLHRLLQSRGEGFARNRHRPLALDLLVIDEVSMVDVPLMQALLEALPPACRLVLVGDRAQLPPVGPGSVLQDLQSPALRTALGPGAVELTRVYRNNGALAAVAAALRDGAQALEPLLSPLPPEANLQWLRQRSARLPEVLLARLRQHQQHLQTLAAGIDPASPAAAAPLLDQLERCLVLTPLRRGWWGVDAIHQALLGDGVLANPQLWPLGTPVLCPVNRDDLGLANGDLGVLVAHNGRRQLLFAPAGSSEPLWVHPALLPGVQPALALTVHKAQGSEADEVWVLLPEAVRQARPLLYTALTRARQRAWLITADLPTLEPTADLSVDPAR
ncbi:MAG: Exodeoxyribonuclease alpha subunit [Cyanobacteriota bacterium]